MKERHRFALVAIFSLAAGSVITAMVYKFAYRTDLEFLGIAQAYVDEGIETLKEYGDDED